MALASLTGTALPTCVYVRFKLPVKTKSIGKVCNIAHSLTLNLLNLLTCISGDVTVIVSEGRSRLVIRKDCSNFISFSTKVVTCLSYLLLNPQFFSTPTNQQV